MQQEQLTALVFVDDYVPSVDFEAVSRVQQPTVNDILGYVDPSDPEAGDGAVVDPTDWNGYLVNYTGCGPGEYNLVFLREGVLEQGRTYSFTTSAIYFSDTLQLLEAQVETGDGEQAQAEEQTQQTEDGEQAEAETETTTEETTTEETTTEETTTEETTTEETPTETTTEETPTTTAEQTTTTADETTAAEETTTVQEVVVNATETGESG